jgi:hypothetical protein
MHKKILPKKNPNLNLQVPSMAISDLILRAMLQITEQALPILQGNWL